jgi:branched-chain amino acid transport system permease protein
MAGYFAAAQFGFVNPDILGWHQSGSVLMMVILGGMGTLSGAVLGAFSVMLLELAFQGLPVVGGLDIGKHWQLLMGGFIVLAVLLLPHGLLGLGRLASRLLKKPAEAAE